MKSLPLFLIETVQSTSPRFLQTGIGPRARLPVRAAFSHQKLLEIMLWRVDNTPLDNLSREEISFALKTVAKVLNRQADYPGGSFRLHQWLLVDKEY